MSSLKSVMNLAAVVAAAGLTAGAMARGPGCPTQGSGLAGVLAWDAANCSASIDNGGNCPAPGTAAETCNGEFSVELTDVSRNGLLTTFEYEVCSLTARGSGLSHWEFGIGQFDCLDEGFSLRDLVVAATLNGVPVNHSFGLDPTTQLFGIKIDLPGGVSGRGCNTFSFTFDESALDPLYRVGVGCVLAATKAGNQDITRSNRPSPGYACIFGPVCELRGEGGFRGCTPGFWKNNHVAWPGAVHPAQAVSSIFLAAFGTDEGAASLDTALGFSGGSGDAGGRRILLRAAVAAYLNAIDEDCENAPAFPFNGEDIQMMVNTALTGTRDEMIALAVILDNANNSVDGDGNHNCHKNAHGDCVH